MSKQETFIVELSTQVVPELKETVQRGKDWINYGADNKYPDFLLELYEESADHQSIIDGVVQYVMGEGIDTTNIKLKEFFDKINDDENINDFGKKIILDYLIFGGFSAQIIPSRGKELAELHWVDFMECRVSEDENTIFHADNWGAWGVKPESKSAFVNKAVATEQIYYFKGHKTRGIYPRPLYNAAIKAILTDVEIGNFHYNNIANGFQVSTIINFNNGEPDPQDKKDIEEAIEKKFNGTKGSKIMTSFNESKDKAVTVEKLNADNFDEQFSTLKNSVQSTIFTAHKVTSPALFGIKMEGTGFSKTEYKEAWEIFNQTVISSMQDTIESELYKIFKPYFPELKREEIMIKPYELKIEDDGTIN